MRVKERFRVCIVGSGFGGINTLFNLKSRFGDSKDVEIILISNSDSFVFTPLLHEVATGEVSPENVAYPIKKLQEEYGDFTFIQEKVIGINFNDKKINCENHNIDYDYLVLAVGVVNNYFGNESIKEHSLALKNVEDAINIRTHISQSVEKIVNEPEVKSHKNFIVVGAGATGIEIVGGLVFFIKDKLKNLGIERFDDINVYLVEATDKVLQEMQDEKYSSMAIKRLNQIGVNLLINHEVKNYDGKTAQIFDKKSNLLIDIDTENFIWAAGFKANPLNDNLDIAKDDKNKIIVDEYLSLSNYPEVYVLGDNAAVENQKLWTTAQVALQQSETVAHNIYARTKLFKYSKKFKYFHQGALVTIGKNYGISDLFGLKITGYSGWFIWKLIHVVKINGSSKKINVFFDWIKTLSYKRYGIT